MGRGHGQAHLFGSVPSGWVNGNHFGHGGGMGLSQGEGSL
jgi:hypothetical protein